MPERLKLIWFFLFAIYKNILLRIINSGLTRSTGESQKEKTITMPRKNNLACISIALQFLGPFKLPKPFQSFVIVLTAVISAVVTVVLLLSCINECGLLQLTISMLCFSQYIDSKILYNLNQEVLIFTLWLTDRDIKCNDVRPSTIKVPNCSTISFIAHVYVQYCTIIKTASDFLKNASYLFFSTSSSGLCKVHLGNPRGDVSQGI